MTSDLIRTVKAHYTDWPYPKPIDDIASWQAGGGYQQGSHALDHHLFWPERSYNPDISILVAGCGTGEAALEAYNHPHATVLGIDLSPTSLEHSAKLKKKHNLVNLELREMDLHEIAALGQKFDHIVSFGVLHALPDTAKGLKALSEVLTDDGVMLLALYSKPMRHGVYMVQDALRRLKVGQTKEDVAFTYDVLKSLPDWHPVQNYMRMTDDLGYPSGIVDTFLHKVDRAFSVADILDLAETANMNFQGWFDNLYYYPDGALQNNRELFERISALPEKERWIVTENLMPSLRGHHRCLMRKKTSDPAQYRIDFAAPESFEMIPVRHHRLKTHNKRNNFRKTGFAIEREWHSLDLSPLEQKLLIASNGENTISAIIKATVKSADEEKTALAFFKRMWRLGHFTYSKAHLYA